MNDDKKLTGSAGISRRDFIKGAAVGAVGVATMGILGACSTPQAEPAPAPAPEAPAPVEQAPAAPAPDPAPEATPEASVSSGKYPSWLGEPPVISDAEITQTITADVVVVGGGHAGVQCARAAAQLGASVAVVEQQGEEYYNWIGEQIGHVNSQFLIDQGLGPYDEAEIINEFSRRCGNRINVDLIRQYVQESGEMFDDAIKVIPEGNDLLDPSQGNVHVAYSSKYPIELSGYKTWAGDMQFRGAVVEDDRPHGSLSRLPEFERLLVADAEKLGAKWYFDQSAVVLTQEADGSVSGVIAKDGDGKYTKYVANKGVAICAGDFGSNADMCYALLNEVAEFADKFGQDPATIIGPGRSGMGQKLGLWAGGYLDAAPRASMTMGGIMGPFGLTPFLMMNCFGKRFMNEAIVLGMPAMINRQPVGILCTVTDSKWLDQVKLNGVDHGAPDFGRPEYFEQVQEDMQHVVAAGASGYPVRSLQFSERQATPIFGANTLEELAGYLGYTGEAKDNFLKTIEEYNKMCAQGADSQYGKDAHLMIPIDSPPYYGVSGANGQVSVGLVTLVGLITDNNMNVLDKSDKPIKGLYAAGNSLGGRYSTAYATPIAGNSIGMAMTHGRILGKHLASL